MLGSTLFAMALIGSQPTPPAAKIGQLAWLEGKWRGDAFGGVLEEEFTSPKGGCVLGTSRIVVEGDRLIHKEFMDLSEKGESLTYTITLPNKTHTFALGAIGDKSVTWVDPENDFPSSISYRREGDQIKVELKGNGPLGKPRVEKITMDRVTEKP